MLAMKILAYVAASIFILLGGIYLLAAVSANGQAGRIPVGCINMLIGVGLILFASRRVKASISAGKIIASLFAGILILFGDIYLISAFIHPIKVLALIIWLISTGAGFGIIWFAQRGTKSAKEELLPVIAVNAEPAGEAKPEYRPRKRGKLAILIGLGITALGILSICCVLVVVYSRRSMLPFEAGGIALKFPANWRQLDPQKITIEYQELIIALGTPKGNGFFKVGKWKVDEQSMAAFAEGMDQTLQIHPEVQLLKKEEILVGGEKAISWNYSGLCPGYPDRTCKYLSVLTQKDRSCYLISYVDDPAPFDNNRSDVNKILASIQFTQGGPTDMLCSSHNILARMKYQQAQALGDQGKLAEAEKMYREALVLDADFCDAMDNLGVVLRKQGKIDEAISWYLKSLEIKPENQLALRNLGIAYQYQDKQEEAIQTFEKLIQVAPDDPEGYYGLGVVYYTLEQHDKAIANLETAEKIYLQKKSRYVIDAQRELGRAYFEQKNCATTKAYLQPIYDQIEIKEDSSVNYMLGVCYLTAEPKDLGLVKEYLLKAEASGYKFPAEIQALLIQTFGEWPPR